MGSSRARDRNRGKQDSAAAGGWLWEPERRVGLVGTGREEIREGDGTWHWGVGRDHVVTMSQTRLSD